jgi:hypothetical protein
MSGMPAPPAGRRGASVRIATTNGGRVLHAAITRVKFRDASHEITRARARIDPRIAVRSRQRRGHSAPHGKSDARRAGQRHRKLI